MALTLSAEQKNITKIFSDSAKYFIPPYQRPYSWEKDECSEFFDDLVNAYHKDKEEGYFLGNIILVNGIDKKDVYEVIDGQQRLSTITLFLKVLFHFDPKNRRLKNTIWIINDRTDDIIEKRLQTNIYIENEFDSLNKVLSLEYAYDYTTPNKDINLFEDNICFFFKKIQKFKDENNLTDFIDFFLFEVTMLPILSDDTTSDKAREKALKIFETINDRGKNLANADIFKSKLFSMAMQNAKEDDFVDRWKYFDTKCQDINYSIDRIFKIYTYIIRGQDGIKSSEIGLREFFMQKNYSPFKYNDYSLVLDNLFKIIDAIEFYNLHIFDTSNQNLSKWFQLINEYTNNYPKDVLFVYLCKYSLEDTKSIIDFSQSLVRYCYFRGSTTNVKYYIYNLAIKIMHDKSTSYFPDSLEDKKFSYLGKLYKGYGLLLAYLDKNTEVTYPYKILRTRDMTKFEYEDFSYYNKIGHTVAVDQNNKPLENISFSEWNDIKHEERQEILLIRLIDFFKDTYEH
jgi:uncharacterized protein with ParB-like and HNH nuclease domain